MTSTLFWVGIGWLAAAVLALRWFHRHKPYVPEWSPEGPASGLCLFCQEPALYYGSATMAVCTECGGLVPRGYEFWRCREPECETLIQGNRYHALRGRCRQHAKWVELREQARKESVKS